MKYMYYHWQLPANNYDYDSSNISLCGYTYLWASNKLLEGVQMEALPSLQASSNKIPPIFPRC